MPGYAKVAHGHILLALITKRDSSPEPCNFDCSLQRDLTMLCICIVQVIPAAYAGRPQPRPSQEVMDYTVKAGKRPPEVSSIPNLHHFH